MWPGVMSRQEAELAPRENDRVAETKENKTAAARVGCISTLENWTGITTVDFPFGGLV